jgi:hypothetical protein
VADNGHAQSTDVVAVDLHDVARRLIAGERATLVEITELASATWLAGAPIEDAWGARRFAEIAEQWLSIGCPTIAQGTSEPERLSRARASRSRKRNKVSTAATGEESSK